MRNVRPRGLWRPGDRLHQRLARAARHTGAVEFRVLGSVGIVDADQLLPVGGEKPRRLLAILLAHRNTRRVGRTARRRALGRSGRRGGGHAPELRVAAPAFRRARRRTHDASQPGAGLRARSARRPRRRRSLRTATHCGPNAPRLRPGTRRSTPRSRARRVARRARSPSSPTPTGSDRKRSASTSSELSRSKRGSRPSCASATTSRSSASSKRSSSTIRSANASGASSCSRSTGRVGRPKRCGRRTSSGPGCATSSASYPSAAIRDLETAILEERAEPRLGAARARRDAARPERFRPETPGATMPAESTPLVGRERDLDLAARLFESSRVLDPLRSGRRRQDAPGAPARNHARARSSPTACGSSSSPRYDDQSAVPAAVGDALDVQQRPNRSLPDSIVEMLGDQQLLLVLDNCEHVLDTTSELVELILRWCPNVHVLATSREPLGIPAEVVWSVPPLPVPSSPRRGAGGARRRSRPCSCSSSGRAPFVTTSCSTRQPREAVAEICIRLDGVPLALELAAARMRSMSAEQLAERLPERFRVLAGTRRATRSSPPDAPRSRAVVVRAAHRSRTARVRTPLDVRGLVRPRTRRTGVRGHGIDELDVSGLLTALVDKSMVVMELVRRAYPLLASSRRCGSSAATGSPRKPKPARCTRLTRTCTSSWPKRPAPGSAAPTKRTGPRSSTRPSTTCARPTPRHSPTATSTRALRLVVALREYAWRRIRYELLAWADVDGEDAGRRGPRRCIPSRSESSPTEGSCAVSSRRPSRRANAAVAAAERLGSPTTGLAERAVRQRALLSRTARAKP